MKYSRRQWDGLIKAWKLQIHAWNARNDFSIGEWESVTTGNDVTKEVEEQSKEVEETRMIMTLKNLQPNLIGVTKLMKKRKNFLNDAKPEHPVNFFKKRKFLMIWICPKFLDDTVKKNTLIDK